ncbi:hypothetical protein GIB67_038444 [Kingdonia uniflora]|uniref:DYW domain-containing protein n=1 Tax=Kingdonia uniflora TaxID=39325 RepID=A0A7J7NP02_9MAGN|nr:hypothetical protein GIB67_038444 [Kingdonia uniflora]
MALSLFSRQIPPPSKPTQTNPNSKSPSLEETLRSDLFYKFKNPFELKQIHSYIIKTNKPHSILPLQRIASICAFSSSFDYARSIFQRVEKPETVIWNSCLKRFAEGDSVIDTIRLFCLLRHSNVDVDTFTCSFVLKACTVLLDLEMSRVVHGLIEKLGFQSDLFLQNTMVHMYACCDKIDDARRLFQKMEQRDVITWNIMITQLTKKGKVDRARDLFDEMPDKSVRSWTAMIAGYVQCGLPKEAVCLFNEMEEAGKKPNEVTLVVVLAACADLGALDLGKRVHEYSNRCGFERNVRICNTLIDMYIKCGCLEDAYRVFNEMGDRTIVSWSAMIGGFAMHGRGEEALRLFTKMNRIGIKPNGVTFVGILHACNHMGLISEGRKFFSSMTRDYGIVPEIEHYGCMVDLLSRSGLLEEAHEFILNMPIKANGVVWGALLGGCRVHKNVELAEEAIKHLHVLDPLNDGYYVVLSNVYANAGRWEDAAKVRMMMREIGVKKTPGWSTITIDGVLHEFVAGDGSHPQSMDIYQKWDELLDQMTLRGYVPDTSIVLLDMEEDKKKHVLYRHSEKLAVVFGLLNTPTRTPIRIMKNLRVCEDCHTSLKLISDIVDREIVEGLAPINLVVENDSHRATPGGTGEIKTIGNYAPVLKAQSAAKAKGYSDVLYLDYVHKRYLEEVSSCNVFVVKVFDSSSPIHSRLKRQKGYLFIRFVLMIPCGDNGSSTKVELGPEACAGAISCKQNVQKDSLLFWLTVASVTTFRKDRVDCDWKAAFFNVKYICNGLPSIYALSPKKTLTLFWTDELFRCPLVLLEKMCSFFSWELIVTTQELHVIDGIPQLIFVRSSYTIEKQNESQLIMWLKPADGGTAATQLAAHLTGIHNAIKILSSRIKVLHHYLLAIHRGDIPCENSLLRQVSSLLRRLPVIDSEKFQDDFLMVSVFFFPLPLLSSGSHPD